jgi:hypothetical protein
VAVEDDSERRRVTAAKEAGESGGPCGDSGGNDKESLNMATDGRLSRKVISNDLY